MVADDSDTARAQVAHSGTLAVSIGRRQLADTFCRRGILRQPAVGGPGSALNLSIAGGGEDEAPTPSAEAHARLGRSDQRLVVDTRGGRDAIVFNIINTRDM